MQNPEVSWQRQSSFRVKKKTLAEGVSGAGSLELSITGFPFRLSPPLPLPSFLPSFLLSPEARTPEPAGPAAPLKHGGYKAASTRRCWTGGRWDSLPCPGTSSCPAPASAGEARRFSRPGALGEEGQTEPAVCSEPHWGRPGAGGSEQHRRGSSEQTAPGPCSGQEGAWSRDVSGRLVPYWGVLRGGMLPVQLLRLGSRWCYPKRRPQDDGNRHRGRGHLQSRAPGWTRRHSPSRCLCGRRGEGLRKGEASARRRRGPFCPAQCSAPRGWGNRPNRL